MTTDGWYGPALADYAAQDGGAFAGPVTIGLLHTTESPRGKYRPGSPTNYGNFGHASFPHFTVDVQLVGGKRVFRCWQHISIRRAAKALRNTAGGVQTNREGAVQIEVVGRAADPFTKDPVLVEGLGLLMRWIESQTDIPRSSSVDFVAYPASYGVRAKQRMSPAAWEAYRGWCGHQHAAENDHGDPGAIDIGLLLNVGIKGATTIKPAAPKPAPPKGNLDIMTFYIFRGPDGNDWRTNLIIAVPFSSLKARDAWIAGVKARGHKVERDDKITVALVAA